MAYMLELSCIVITTSHPSVAGIFKSRMLKMESTRTALFLTSPSAAHGTHYICNNSAAALYFMIFIHRFMSELLGMLKIPIVLIFVALGQILM